MSVFGDRILLATDGSPEAERALRISAMLSERLGAELHLVSVEPMPDPLSWPEARLMSPELRGDVRERAEEEARKLLQGQVEKIEEMDLEVSGVHAVAGLTRRSYASPRRLGRGSWFSAAGGWVPSGAP